LPSLSNTTEVACNESTPPSVTPEDVSNMLLDHNKLHIMLEDGLAKIVKKLSISCDSSSVLGKQHSLSSLALQVSLET
jgi:hypothetical protein